MTAGNKVKVGFFSFTEVTDPREHHSYNEWHQLDHMPEQFPLAGVAYGQRWVSTPSCRAARAVSGDRLDPIHYVTLYLMTEPVDRTLREFFDLGKELHRKDRFHQHRKAHLSGPFLLVAAAAAPRVLISSEAVPYRPHRGIYVTVQDASSDAASIETAVTIPGVAGAWSFADDQHRITVMWCDDEVLEVAARVGSADRAEFAGPFETITPWQWDWFDE